MPSTTLHFHNVVTGPVQDQILIFLKPVQASAVYKYAAWQVLNPGQKAHQSAVINTEYGVSARLFTDPDDDYTDPYSFQSLGGAPVTVVNTAATSIQFGPTDPSAQPMTPDQVGVENSTTGLTTGLTLQWYVNGALVVESNNTSDTQLTVNSTSTFELEQAIYVMLSNNPVKGPNYELQTYSNATKFAVPNSATDLYFEEYTDTDGVTNRIRQVTQQDYHAAIAAHREIKRAMRLLNGNGSYARKVSDPAFGM